MSLLIAYVICNISAKNIKIRSHMSNVIASQMWDVLRHVCSSLAVLLCLLVSERELFTFAICCRLSVCRLSVVCLSVTLVRRTQAVQIFGNISMALGTLAIR